MAVTLDGKTDYYSLNPGYKHDFHFTASVRTILGDAPPTAAEIFSEMAQ